MRGAGIASLLLTLVTSPPHPPHPLPTTTTAQHNVFQNR